MSALMAAALVAELFLLLLVLLGVSWLRSRAAARRDAKAVKVLITRIKQGKDGREQAIREYLSQQIGLSGDALEQTGMAILRAELALLQRFAGIYRQRDAGAAAQFDIDLAAALMPYQSLSADGALPGAETAGESGDAVDPAVLEALRAENAGLEDELRITMETMSRMLNEYSTMFGGGPPSEGLAFGAATPAISAAAAAVAAAQLPEDASAVNRQPMEPLAGNHLAGGGWPEIDSGSEQDLFAVGDMDVPPTASDREAVADESPEDTAADTQAVAGPDDFAWIADDSVPHDMPAASSGLEAVADILAEVDQAELAAAQTSPAAAARPTAAEVAMEPSGVAAHDGSEDFDIEVAAAEDDLFDAIDDVAPTGASPASGRE